MSFVICFAFPPASARLVRDRRAHLPGAGRFWLRKIGWIERHAVEGHAALLSGSGSSTPSACAISRKWANRLGGMPIVRQL